MSYSNYLKSTHWQKIRKRVIKRAGGTCEKKGCDRELTDVRHKTYARLGCEKLSDLEGLCFLCHKRAHPEKDFGEWERPPLDAHSFDCKLCSSTNADLYISKHKLHFICRKCGEPVVRKRAHRIRRDNKKSNRLCSCLFCGKTYWSQDSLDRHVKENHTDAVNKRRETKPNTCSFCNKTLANSQGRMQHEKSVHDYTFVSSIFQCDLCKEDFGSKYSLQQHVKDSHRTCMICQKVFVSPQAAKQHKQDVHSEIHRKKNKNLCFFCEKDVGNQLEAHLLEIHGLPQIPRSAYTCVYCEITHATKKQCWNHLKNEHGVKNIHI